MWIALFTTAPKQGEGMSGIPPILQTEKLRLAPKRGLATVIQQIEDLHLPDPKLTGLVTRGV